MNTSIAFLTIVILSITQVFSAPVDSTATFEYSTDSVLPESTITITTTVTTSTTTTTTTTLAPELDRDWEDLVLAGPTAVNYLSLFMVLASRQDKPLVSSADKPAQHFPAGQSLHGILTRIAADMRAAFQVASADLVRTRSSMDQIPDHIKAGLVLIQTAPKDLLGKLLSYTLRNVERAAIEGSAVAKPTLGRFVSLGLLLDELISRLGATASSAGAVAADADYFSEATAYANDIKKQWTLLVKLFQKFADRADLTQGSVSSNFIDVINQADKSNGFDSQSKRTGHLDKLVPAAIAIDQSAALLDMMARTYSEVSNDHMATQITASNNYLALAAESTRVTSQRQIWQNTIAQSVKVARLAQERQNQFADTTSNRHTEYSAYLQAVAAPATS